MSKTTMLNNFEFSYAWEDEERNHVKADKLLLQYIDDESISEAFEAIDKWYA